MSTFLVFLGVLLYGVLSFGIGAFYGAEMSKNSLQNQAIDKGMGCWVVDQNSGKRVFILGANGGKT